MLLRRVSVNAVRKSSSKMEDAKLASSGLTTTSLCNADIFSMNAAESQNHTLIILKILWFHVSILWPDGFQKIVSFLGIPREKWQFLF